MSFFKNLFGKKENTPTPAPTKNEVKDTPKPAVDFDINVPIENPELVKAMNTFFVEGNEANLMKVIDSLLPAKFLVLSVNDEMETEQTETGTVIKKDSVLKFLQCVDNNDNVFLPLFTDWTEAGKWVQHDKNIGGFVMHTFEAFEFANRDGNYSGILINPGSEPWLMNTEQISNFLSDFKK